MWHTHKQNQYCEALIALTNKSMFLFVPSSSGINILIQELLR